MHKYKVSIVLFMNVPRKCRLINGSSYQTKNTATNLPSICLHWRILFHYEIFTNGFNHTAAGTAVPETVVTLNKPIISNHDFAKKEGQHI